MNNKTILFLTGPSCSGKTTILNNLIEKTPNNYLVSYDKLKWQLHGYDRENHREVMRKLSLGYLDVVCSEGFFVFLELWTLDESAYSKLNDIASKHDYAVKIIHVTASEKILMERCRDRIDTAKLEGSKASITDEKIYQKRLEEKQYLPEGTISIDTSRISTDEATIEVQEVLNS